MKDMISLIDVFLLFLLFIVVLDGRAQTGALLPYQNSQLTSAERAEDLLNRMTLAEKADMVAGTGFDSKPLPRLGIPALAMTDGPVGVRTGQATAFPVSVAMAASWDIDLIHQIGQALGQETKAKGKNVLLAPCVNIHRVPYGGRNFESFGEDPYLAARMATAFIQGVQSEKVIATVKHFACNNQEFERMSIDVQVDERTLHEIYLPAFKAAVQEAGVWALMSAYNRLNGHYCSGSTYLLTEILKNRWDFKGFVMSDWGAVHSTIPDLHAGLDLEMPSGRYFSQQAVMNAVIEGSLSEAKLNDKIRRMLTAIFAMGYFDAKAPDPGAVDTPEHRQLALTLAQNSMVLLKNADNLLPLNRKKIKSIAVIGPNAGIAITGGGGSSKVDPVYAISPLDGLKARSGKSIRVGYQRGIAEKPTLEPIPVEFLKPPPGVAGDQGLLAEYFDNIEFQGEPAIRRIDPQVNFNVGDGVIDPQLKKDHISIRWTGRLVPKVSGRYALGVSSDDGTRLFLNGKLLIDNWGDHGIVTKTDTLNLEAGQEYDIRIDFYENAGGAAARLGWLRLDQDSYAQQFAMEKQKALELARKSDVVVICVGSTDQTETEGIDRASLSLPEDQENLILSVVQENPHAIVVLNSGSAVLMERWMDRVPALLAAWFPGQEGGNALADILFGTVNPSGKLPTTFVKNWQDAAAFNNYPGENGLVHYTEGIWIGYRYFEQNRIEPLFPFGFGLSYTTFAYQDLQVQPLVNSEGKVKVSLSVENTGKRAGAEVVQFYIHDLQASVERPVKELKGFQKVFLQPGEKKTVHFELDKSALSFYDSCRHDWVAEPGEFQLLIGSSVSDIRLTDSFELK